MTSDFVVLKSAWNREEDEIPDLQLGAFDPFSELRLIPSQSWQALTEPFVYMLGEGGAVKRFGLLIWISTELIGHT
ncbi:hypothetical protein D3C81_2025530 [compost metagenome]